MLPIWLGGFLFGLINIAWFLQTQPASWTGINPIQAQALSVVFWIVVSLATSFGWLIFGWLSFLVNRRYSLQSWQAFAMLPVAWTLGEYSRSWLFTLVTWGAGGTWGPHWNLGNLGFSLSATPLVYIGRWIGMFGLSAVAIVSALAIFWLIRKRYLPALIVIAALVVCSWVASTISGKPSIQSLTVGAIQLSDRNNDAPQLSRLSSSKKLDLLVLPEYTSPDSLYHKNRQQVTTELFKSPGSLFIYAQNQPSTNKNEIIFERANGQLVAHYDKTLLVPGGEYFLGWASSLLRASGNSRAVDAYNQLRQLSKGTEEERAISYRGTTYGALACSGVSSPYFFQDLSRQGAQVLTNSASLGVFAQSSYFHQQARQMLRFHAVANAKPLVQAARKGYAYIIHPNGQIVSTSLRISDNLLVGQITTSNATTPYTRFGEIWLNLCLFIVGLGLSWFVYNKIKSPH